jgi:ubiquitin C-terminal hydrolase
MAFLFSKFQTKPEPVKFRDTSIAIEGIVNTIGPDTNLVERSRFIESTESTEGAISFIPSSKFIDKEQVVKPPIVEIGSIKPSIDSKAITKSITKLSTEQFGDLKPITSTSAKIIKNVLDLGLHERDIYYKGLTATHAPEKQYNNNREKFVSHINSFFNSIKDRHYTMEYGLKLHQKLMVEYMANDTPYRGVLIYHGLGSGKTFTAIAMAEAMKDLRQIWVFTPAQLRHNFIEEFKKLGSPMYSLLYQRWQFYKLPSSKQDEIAQYIAGYIPLTVQYIISRGGVWLPNEEGRAYSELDKQEQQTIDQQLNEIIRSKYKFFNINGIGNIKKYTESIRENKTDVNPFNGKTVIIDEVHQFVSMISNRLSDTEPSLLNKNWAYQMYLDLMAADDIKLIFLTGTPIVNYPNESGIMFNMLRGYIREFKFIFDTDKSHDEIMNALRSIDNIDKIELTRPHGQGKVSTRLVITMNPFRFKSSYSKKLAYNGLKYDSKKKLRTTQEFMTGVKNILIRELGKDSVIFGINDRNHKSIEMKEYKLLPDDRESFDKMYVEGIYGGVIRDISIKNIEQFKRRILGLSSYYKNTTEGLPEYKKEKDFKLEFLKFHGQHEIYYRTIRKEEEEIEQQQARNKTKKTLGDENTQSFRTKSRMACNFAFPVEIKRPVLNPKLFTSSKFKRGGGGDEDIEIFKTLKGIVSAKKTNKIQIQSLCGSMRLTFNDQHDADEFIGHIINALETVNPAIYNKFKIDIRETRSCIDDTNQKQTIYQSSRLNIALKEKYIIDVQQLLKNSTERHVVNDVWDTCTGGKYNLETSYNANEYVIIQLKRFNKHINPKTNEIEYYKVDIPVLNSHSNININGVEYTPVSMIEHVGAFHPSTGKSSGHYTAYIKQDDQWMKIDDMNDSVYEPVEFVDVPKNEHGYYFGSDKKYYKLIYTDGTISRANTQHASLLKSQKSPYIIFYKKVELPNIDMNEMKFKNMHNACYMHSALQAILRTPVYNAIVDFEPSAAVHVEADAEAKEAEKSDDVEIHAVSSQEEDDQAEFDAAVADDEQADDEEEEADEEEEEEADDEQADDEEEEAEEDEQADDEEEEAEEDEQAEFDAAGEEEEYEEYEAEEDEAEEAKKKNENEEDNIIDELVYIDEDMDEITDFEQRNMVYNHLDDKTHDALYTHIQQNQDMGKKKKQMYALDVLRSIKQFITEYRDAIVSEREIPPSKYLPAGYPHKRMLSIYEPNEKLNDYSQKFYQIIRKVQNVEGLPEHIGKHLIYSQYLNAPEGLITLKMILHLCGYSQFKLKVSKDKTGFELDMTDEEIRRPSFIIYSGKEDKVIKQQLLHIFNNNTKKINQSIKEKIKQVRGNKGFTNLYGELIKMFIITSSGAEGIDLKHVRVVHMIESYWNPARTDQVIGRAIRTNSHIDLPEHERKVKAYLYLMTFYDTNENHELVEPEEGADMAILRRDETTDEHIYEASETKRILNDHILKAIKESAVDCIIHSEVHKEEELNCVSLPPTDKELYKADYKLDTTEKVDTLNITTRTIKYIGYEIDGKKYYITQTDKKKLEEGKLPEVNAYEKNAEGVYVLHIGHVWTYVDGDVKLTIMKSAV